VDRSERFTDIFRGHRLQVTAYVRRRIGAEAAQEIVADTFLAAWRHLDSLPADPVPWLYRAAAFEIANHRRRAARVAELNVRVSRLDTAHESDVAETVVAASAFRAALAALSDSDREVLFLAAWEQLAPAQAAAVLGCSVAGYRVRLHRARRRLDDLVGERAGTTVHAPPAALAEPTPSATPKDVSSVLDIRPLPDAGAVFSPFHRL